MKTAKVLVHNNSLFNSRSYRIGNLLIDPGDEWDEANNIEAVLLTHAHFDHIYGLNRIVENNPDVKVYTNAFGAEMLSDPKKNFSFYHETPYVFDYKEKIVITEDLQILAFSDNTVAKAFFTPGHNPSCITWLIGDAVFTGDSYIPGIKVVTNLPGGNKLDALESIERILDISKDKKIYPGHPASPGM